MADCRQPRSVPMDNRGLCGSAGRIPVLQRVVGMGSHPVLVLDDLPVEFVYEEIYCGVQVLVVALDEDLLATHVAARLGLLSRLVDAQDHVDVDDMIEVTTDARKLRLDIAADRGR